MISEVPRESLLEKPASSPRWIWSVGVRRDNLALGARAQCPDHLIGGAVLEELHRAVAHQGVAAAGVEAAHPDHAGTLQQSRVPREAAVRILRVRRQQGVAQGE